MATSSNPRFTIDQRQRLDQDIADIEEKLHSITRLVRVYYDADSPAAIRADEVDGAVQRLKWELERGQQKTMTATR
jgi:hypothetical protein